MEYSHVTLQAGMLTPDFLDQFRSHLAMLPQYHYQQDADWFLCGAAPGGELLVTKHGGEIVASSVVCRTGHRFARKAKYLVRNGPLFRDFRSLTVHLQGLLEMLSGSAIDIRISPPVGEDIKAVADRLLAGAGFRWFRSYTGNYTSTVVVELESGLEHAFAGFSPALKRQLRKADKIAARVVAVREPGELRELLERVHEFYGRRGLGMPEAGVLDCYLQHKILGRGEGVALGLQLEGKEVAGIVVVGCGDRAIFSYGYREECGDLAGMPLTHALHYSAIRWAVENGYRYYDFGGYSEEGGDDGINRFKLGFSGRIEMVSDNYLYTCHPLVTSLSLFLDRIRYRPAGRPQ